MKKLSHTTQVCNCFEVLLELTTVMMNENETMEEASSSDLPFLPDHIWAIIVQFLPYSDVMQVAATNKFFLEKVLPLVQTLYILTPNQLTVPQAQRFANGGVISVYLGIIDRISGSADADDQITHCMDFLGLFPKLQEVHYGQMCYRHNTGDRDIFVTWRGKRNLTYNQNPYLRTINVCPMREHSDSRFVKIAEIHHALLNAVDSAIQKGRLPKTVKFYGLVPINNEPICQICDNMKEKMFLGNAKKRKHT